MVKSGQGHDHDPRQEGASKRGDRPTRSRGDDQAARRGRALARLAQLGDEPGGEEFLARMGALGDWIVDFAFGDVHTRPGLDARERELIILAVLAAQGSNDPQVRAHIRALRAIGVPWEQIEEAILQITPYAGIPRAVNAVKCLRAEQEEAP